MKIVVGLYFRFKINMKELRVFLEVRIKYILYYRLGLGLSIMDFYRSWRLGDIKRFGGFFLLW